MTRAELTEEGGWNLPRAGAPHMDNLIATILGQSNRSKWLKLDRIADFQGFDAGEFRARFAHLETAWEAELFRRSQVPNNSYDVEGK